MKKDFMKKTSEVVDTEPGINIFGVEEFKRFRTVSGVSNLTSRLGFLGATDDDVLCQIPDYVLSAELEKDIANAVHECATALKQTKYLPDNTGLGGGFDSLADGDENEDVFRNWKDFQILNCDGQPLYIEADFLDWGEHSREALATALWLIVKDICNDGRMLSLDWYRARILLEYFCDYPLPPENAFLIGKLYNELCVKLACEGDLAAYYAKLSQEQVRREKGADATKKKAEELRTFCVDLFAEMAISAGPRLMFAKERVQAVELHREALRLRPDDFARSGNPYKVEWFQKHILEDRKLDIVQQTEKLSAK